MKLKYILLSTIVLFMAACSPRYKIKTHYTLPTDFVGKQCVQTCSNERKNCQNRCNQKQNHCLSTAEQSARDTFPALMREYQDVEYQYTQAIHGYNLDMDAWKHQEHRLTRDLEHYRKKCQPNNKNSYECKRLHETKDELYHLRRNEPGEPIRPVQPSLSVEIKEAQKSCNNECGCEKEYNNCFVSCGGKLDYEKFCVENCK